MSLYSIIHPRTLRKIVFGRLMPANGARFVKMADLISLSTLPTAPERFSWAYGNPSLNQAGLLNVLHNDQAGCCTCSAVGHIEDAIKGASGNPYTPYPPDDVLWLYSKVTNPPFDPKTFANDNGADEHTVFEFWRQNGCHPDGSGKILGVAYVDPINEALVSSALWLFENGYDTAGLPNAWLPTRASDPAIWDVAGPPNMRNGHAFMEYGYNANSTFVDTWGEIKQLTRAAKAKYCNRVGGGGSYVILSEETINLAKQKAPTGFDLDQLKAAFAGLPGV